MYFSEYYEKQVLIIENPKCNWEIFVSVCSQILATANVKIFLSEDPGLHDSLCICHFDSFSFQISSENTFFFLPQASILFFTSMQLLGMKDMHEE